MNFATKLASLFRKKVAPTHQPAPKQQKRRISVLNEVRRRFRLNKQRPTGAFGKHRVRIDPRPANNAARGHRPGTWWKSTGSRLTRHAHLLGTFVTPPPIHTRPDSNPASRRPVGDRSRDRNNWRRYPLGGIITPRRVRA